MSKVNTVLGPLDPSRLGFTLSHEHILMADDFMRRSFPGWIDIRAVAEQAVISLKKAKAAGVDTIIDATPINLGRDVLLMREVSERTGVNIIACTGFYYQERPWFRENNYSIDNMADMLAGEVQNGMQGTDSRPGMIKCATEDYGLTPMNEKLLRTAARVHKLTGLPIMTHASVCNRSGLMQQEIFKDEGVDLSRVIIGHCDDSCDLEYVPEVLKKGSYVGMDRIGVESLNPFDNRMDIIEMMIKAGFGNKLVLSHDCNIMSDCGRVGGVRGIKKDDPDWNFCIVPQKVLPELRRRGVSEETIKDLTVNNIRTLFEGCE